MKLFIVLLAVAYQVNAQWSFGPNRRPSESTFQDGVRKDQRNQRVNPGTKLQSPFEILKALNVRGDSSETLFAHFLRPKPDAQSSRYANILKTISEVRKEHKKDESNESDSSEENSTRQFQGHLWSKTNVSKQSGRDQHSRDHIQNKGEKDRSRYSPKVKPTPDPKRRSSEEDSNEERSSEERQTKWPGKERRQSGPSRRNPIHEKLSVRLERKPGQQGRNPEHQRLKVQKDRKDGSEVKDVEIIHEKTSDVSHPEQVQEPHNDITEDIGKIEVIEPEIEVISDALANSELSHDTAGFAIFDELNVE